MSSKHRRSPVRLALAVAVAVLGALAGGVAFSAQEDPAPEAAPTPRTAVRAFLEATDQGEYERAAQLLDLSELGARPGDAQAAKAARDVRDVLDRLVGRID